MANNYTPHTAKACVPCTKIQFELLSQLLAASPVAVADGADDDDDDGFDESNDHGFQVEFDERSDEVYLSAEMCGDESCLLQPFLQELGKLIQAAGMEFLEMGYACTCDKLRVGSHGGGYYRIMPDGLIVFPTLVWPTTPSQAVEALDLESPHPIP